MCFSVLVALSSCSFSDLQMPGVWRDVLEYGFGGENQL